MFNKFKNKAWIYKLGSMVSAFALTVTAYNVNTTCVWFAHQDELPKDAKRLRKF